LVKSVSKNKIYVKNGEEEETSDTSDAGHLKELLAGYHRAFLSSEAVEMLPGLDLTFEELGYTLKDGKAILSGVSGRIHSGRVTAILGPSGAGKVSIDLACV